MSLRYALRVTSIVEKIEIADKLGDRRKVDKLVNVISSKTTRSQGKQPTKNKQGELIKDAQELGEVWQEFLQGEFSATDLEHARDEYPELDPFDEGEDRLTHKEFVQAVKRMKLNKAAGPDNIPVEKIPDDTRSTLLLLTASMGQRMRTQEPSAMCVCNDIHTRKAQQTTAKIIGRLVY